MIYLFGIGIDRIYVLCVGIFLCLVALFELVSPEVLFNLWEKWMATRFFFLHGIILILGGFPLTLYKGPLSTIIFIIGLIPVITGPFILLYPEKIQKIFTDTYEEFKRDGVKKIIYFDAALRISIGFICILSYFL